MRCSAHTSGRTGERAGGRRQTGFLEQPQMDGNKNAIPPLELERGGRS